MSRRQKLDQRVGELERRFEQLLGALRGDDNEPGETMVNVKAGRTPQPLVLCIACHLPVPANNLVLHLGSRRCATVAHQRRAALSVTAATDPEEAS